MNRRKNEWYSAMMDAILANEESKVQTLLKANVYEFLSNTEQMLLYAAHNGQIGIYKLFVSTLKEYNSETSANISEPLERACRKYHLDMIGFLLANKLFDPDRILRTLNGCVVKQDASHWIKVVELFFQFVPDVKNHKSFNPTDYYETMTTLYHTTIKYGTPEMLAFLLDNSARETWQLQDTNNVSVLEIAIKQRNPAMLQVLATRNLTNFCIPNSMPLHAAMCERNTAVCATLLAWNPSFDAPNADIGNTTLHCASAVLGESQHAILFKKIFQLHEKDATTKNKAGHLPYRLALINNNTTACQIFESILNVGDRFDACLNIDHAFQKLGKLVSMLMHESVWPHELLSLVIGFVGFFEHPQTKKRKAS